MRFHFAALSAAIVMFVAVQPVAAQQAAFRCRDGSTSAISGRGACSHHGGLDKRAASAAENRVSRQENRGQNEVTRRGNVVVETCADGTTSTATGRGVCSHHGGVAGAAPMRDNRHPAPRIENRPELRRTAARNNMNGGSGAREDNNPAGAIAQCRDGMFSHSAHRQGACGHHGGVGKWM